MISDKYNSNADYIENMRNAGEYSAWYYDVNSTEARHLDSRLMAGMIRLRTQE